MARRTPPMRRCVGCGVRQAKDSLVRVVRTPRGEIVVDPGGKKPGRGAYVCPDAECVEQLFQKKRLHRALRVSEIDENTKDELFTRLLHTDAE